MTLPRDPADIITEALRDTEAVLRHGSGAVAVDALARAGYTISSPSILPPYTTRRDLFHYPSDPLGTCWSCEAEGDANAHTDPDPTPGPGLPAVAEATAGELICWCGHSLHYADCPDDGACHIGEGASAYCANRWRAE